MKTVITSADLRKISAGWRSAQEKIAFVPTMGALHHGHLALVEQAKALADRVVVSIFVNPLQFGPKEDFATYPRMLQADSEKLQALAVDALFLPNAADMYPAGFETYIVNDSLADILCGHFRPGHFRGVLTVVAKLFNLVQPDFALFGKKDFQQFHMIQKMVRDLSFPIQVVGAETIRESDGLAMSSRNLRLSKDERALAPKLFQCMEEVQNELKNGFNDKAALLQNFKKRLEEFPDFRLEYAEIRRLADLANFEQTVDQAGLLVIAAHLGSVRLIDNLELAHI